MKYEISEKVLPVNLVISQELKEDEIPKVFMKIIQVKMPKKENAGASFHEKSAKNSKVNFIIKKKDRMMKKYGKPIKRAAKK